VSIQFGNSNSATSHLVLGTHSQAPSFPVTMSIWFYSNRTAGREPLLSFSCTDVTNEDVFELSLTMLSNATTTSRRVEAAVYDFWNGVVRAQTATGTGAGWSTNSWVHAAGVFESSTNRVAYLNGGFTGSNITLVNIPEQISTFGVNLNVATSSGIGTGHDAAGQVVRMAEAAIWDAALTTDEILALSKGAKPKTVRPDSLIFYSPLVRGNTSKDSIVLEETGNCPLTVTYTGTPISYTDHTRRYG